MPRYEISIPGLKTFPPMMTRVAQSLDQLQFCINVIPPANQLEYDQASACAWYLPHCSPDESFIQELPTLWGFSRAPSQLPVGPEVCSVGQTASNPAIFELHAKVLSRDKSSVVKLSLNNLERMLDDLLDNCSSDACKHEKCRLQRIVGLESVGLALRRFHGRRQCLAVEVIDEMMIALRFDVFECHEEEATANSILNEAESPSRVKETKP